MRYAIAAGFLPPVAVLVWFGYMISLLLARLPIAH